MPTTSKRTPPDAGTNSFATYAYPRSRIRDVASERSSAVAIFRPAAAVRGM